jgi:DNA polymerase-1
MKLLIDADYIVYKACSAAEEDIDWGDDVIMVVSNLKDARRHVQNDLDRIKSVFPFSEEIILFFSDSINFRKKILPSYKGHRNRKTSYPYGYTGSR